MRCFAAGDPAEPGEGLQAQDGQTTATITNKMSICTFYIFQILKWRMYMEYMCVHCDCEL